MGGHIRARERTSGSPALVINLGHRFNDAVNRITVIGHLTVHSSDHASVLGTTAQPRHPRRGGRDAGVGLLIRQEPGRRLDPGQRRASHPRWRALTALSSAGHQEHSGDAGDCEQGGEPEPHRNP